MNWRNMITSRNLSITIYPTPPQSFFNMCVCTNIVRLHTCIYMLTEWQFKHSIQFPSPRVLVRRRVMYIQEPRRRGWKRTVMMGFARGVPLLWLAHRKRNFYVTVSVVKQTPVYSRSSLARFHTDGGALRSPTPPLSTWLPIPDLYMLSFIIS